MTETIKWFRDEYRFLSNFYPSTVIGPSGYYYPTVEHAFQASKTLFLEEQLNILHAHSAGVAKTLGRRVTLRTDWDEIKEDVMYKLVYRKFKYNIDLERKLLETGDAFLIEGNTWNDTYWGICYCSLCNGIGKNRLGEILMRVRQTLRRERIFS